MMDIELNWEEALNYMRDGYSVESLVSNTEYSIDKHGNFLTEGDILIKEDYITSEEREGYFIVTELIDCDSGEISEDIINRTLQWRFKKRKFDEKYRDIKSKNIIKE